MVKMKLHLGFLVFLFVFNFWSVSASPCGSWSFYKTRDVILAHPVEEEIFLVTFSEDEAEAEAEDDDEGDVSVAYSEKENPLQTDNISHGLDDMLNGEVVDSADNKKSSFSANSEALPSNEKHKTLQQTYNTTEETTTTTEDAGFTTENDLKEE